MKQKCVFTVTFILRKIHLLLIISLPAHTELKHIGRLVNLVAGERSPIKNTNKIPISGVLLLLTGSCLPPQFLPLLQASSCPFPPCPQPLRQATHLVSFLLVLLPLPRSNKGANHYNWHPAVQLSHLGEVPLAKVWVNRGGIHVVCYLNMTCSLTFY